MDVVDCEEYMTKKTKIKSKRLENIVSESRKKSDWRVVLGESHSSARVGAVGSPSLVSVQAQDWVSRDAVTRRYIGGSELGFCPGKLLGVLRTARGDSHLLVPGGGGSESSTVAAKDSEGRRLLQLCSSSSFREAEVSFALHRRLLFP
ncbi:hypothetical protein YC2023_083370 [Brassica napus]